MTTEKFVIKGFDPKAKAIFAFESQFKTDQNIVYLCRDKEGLFFSSKIENAFIFTDEDEVASVVDSLELKDNLKGCDWNYIMVD